MHQCLDDPEACAKVQEEYGLFRSIVEELKEIVFRTDIEGRWTFLNPAWEEITGFSVAESIGTVFLDYIHPDDRALNLERFKPLIERRKDSCNHEIRYLRKDGGFRWVEVHARLVFDIAGAVAGTCGTIRDITLKRQALEDLSATKARLQNLLASSPAVIFTLDPSRSYSVTWSSENSLSMFGYTAQEFADNPRLWLEVFHPQDRRLFRDFKRRLMSGEPAGVQVRYRHRNGTWHWLRSEVKTVSPGEAVGCMIDTTETTQALERLKMREAILEAVSFVAARFLEGDDWEAALPESLEHLRQAALTDRVWLFENVQQNGVRMVRPRYGLDASAGDPNSVLIPIIPQWDEALDRGETVCTSPEELPEPERSRILNKRIRTLVLVPVYVGSIRWGCLGFDCHSEREWSQATLDGLRAAARIVGAAIRQSQSRQCLREAHEELENRVAQRTRELAAANLALRESEQLYRTLVELSPDAIVVSDLDHRITMVNHRCQELFKLDRPEIALGQDGAAWVTQEDLALAQRFRSELLVEGRLHGWELRLLRCDGTVFIAEVGGSLVYDGNGRPRHILRVIRDVTGRKQLEDQYRQAQKMEAVGRLAGGVAHDFNNLLTVIKGYSDLLLGKLRDDPANGKKVMQILRAADRAARLVEQLLAFSRKQIVEPKVVDVNVALGEMEKMLHRLIGEDIEFTTSFDPDAGNVRIDPGHFDQMVMNLAVNARDAMHSGGTFSISTRPAFLPQESTDPSLQSLPPGRYLVLEVQDTGAGMSAEVLPHIFEPFFTTKQVGKGTGLGLSTVYGIVEGAGGRILVESQSGLGSTFRIYLPVVAGSPAAEPAATSADGVYGGHETILVAEDSDSVRAMIVESLEEYGYTVIAANNGHRALQLAASAQSTIHLLVTDVVMPRLGGLDLAAEMAELYPHLRVLYMSGYTERKLPEGAYFLKKPFSPDVLGLAVRHALAPQPDVKTSTR